MIYPHQQKAIDFITQKYLADTQAEALLIGGSIAHGYNDEKSDVDINIVVSEDVFRHKAENNALTCWESAESFYEGGYFDGKYISRTYLEMAAERGNEPTRFALHDAITAFDRTGRVEELLRRIGAFDDVGAAERELRFLAQLEGWHWYCGEALRRQDAYLLDVSASRLILYAGRMILLRNRTFFPYHKWFMRTLEGAPDKPSKLMDFIRRVLAEKSRENIDALYGSVKEWLGSVGGNGFDWPSHFVRDVETVWMRQEEFVENM